MSTKRDLALLIFIFSSTFLLTIAFAHNYKLAINPARMVPSSRTPSSSLRESSPHCTLFVPACPPQADVPPNALHFVGSNESKMQVMPRKLESQSPQELVEAFAKAAQEQGEALDECNPKKA
ncbi:MAG TPA: hypothetical protein VFI95_23850 [Terriglobales bacterium]|nr:hypothetical protein [Terriglobales bacterium]